MRKPINHDTEDIEQSLDITKAELRELNNKLYQAGTKASRRSEEVESIESIVTETDTRVVAAIISVMIASTGDLLRKVALLEGILAGAASAVGGSMKQQHVDD